MAAQSEGRKTARSCCRDTKIQLHTELPHLTGYHFCVCWEFQNNIALDILCNVIWPIHNFILQLLILNIAKSAQKIRLQLQKMQLLVRNLGY